MFYWVEAGHSGRMLQPGERFVGHIVLDNQGFQGFNRGRGREVLLRLWWRYIFLKSRGWRWWRRW